MKYSILTYLKDNQTRTRTIVHNTCAQNKTNPTDFQNVIVLHFAEHFPLL